ncbi:MAG: UDP-forming cellulose synthase catalytic subunit [Pseudomonadota bacterium]
MSDPNTSYGLSNAAREGQPWSTSLISNIWDRRIERVIELKFWDQPLLLLAILILCALPVISIVSTPLALGWQTFFGLGMLLLALWINRIQGRLATHVMILLSVLASSRYMYWRVTESFGNGNGRDATDLFFAGGLVAAEAYAFIVLMLGYFQVLWPLNRKPATLPRDMADWPTVDIFIPTYNEPLKVVRPTVLAALDLDWPKDKLRIYVLDDGKRAQFKEFCDEVGVTHITRSNSKHAKAGNLNAAMTKTQGEFVAIFDCDHIPTRSFLQVSMGWFKRDPKLAMTQTPHHFFSPDPFERNLDTFRKVPNEGELFYGLLQDGNDFWNATFFCGSCAVLRRSALDEVGGIAVETVTEDAHTALKMHRKGWTTAYLNIPQAAGLATESLSAHVGQRIRWARGMAQIFRIDNPLFGRGLTWGQRLCYSNAMLHFFYGLPRVVFLTAPLSYLFFEAHIIEASALMIAAYAFPHLAHSSITNSRIQGPYRHSFWAEVYETVLATYILVPTLLALINPKLGTFNVTAKGGMNNETYFDQDIARPYVFLLILNLLGLLVGLGRFVYWNTHEVDTVVLNMVWTVYNTIIIGAALAVAWESRQVRRTIRVNVAIGARIRIPDGPEIEAVTADISEGGTGLKLAIPQSIPQNAMIEVALAPDFRLVWTPAKVVRSKGESLFLEFAQPMSIDQERQLVYAIFGRADAWVSWSADRPNDRIGESFRAILDFGLGGTIRIVKMTFTNLKNTMTNALSRLLSPLTKRSGTALMAVALLTAALLQTGTVIAQAPPASDTVAVSEPLAIPQQASLGSRSESRVLSFESLGVQKPIRLRGVQGEIALPVAVRDDELVTRARLTLKFAHSPSLIFPLSHLNILVNNELAATIPLSSETASGAERTIDIDPKLFVEYNQIGLQLIAHYTMDCEDPVHTTLWSIIDNRSTLELDTQPLPRSRDLNLLPQPFFDSRDSRRVNLPFVFAGTPSMEEIDAAGVVASWFGALADYRGASFPVYFNKLPTGHGVVFINGNKVPAGLNLPADSATAKVQLIPNPEAPGSLLLIVRGATGEGIKTAARSLALGTQALSGQDTAIKEFIEPAPRKAYDAPRWVPTDRPVQLGELVRSYALESSGLYPDTIKVPFHAPPDLFTWRGRGMKLDLKYRYTPTIGAKSTLNVNINNEFVEAIALAYTGEDKASEQRINLPFVSEVQSVNRGTVYVPEYKFSSDNTLQFQYYFERKKEGACKDVILDNLRGSIDEDSTIDLTAYPHYTALPDLTLFANGGFPYTKYADLDQTAVVLPERLDPEEVEAFLTVMGRIGEATGYPATRFKLGRAAEASGFSDLDLIVIGAGGNQPLLETWAEYMPMSISNGETKLKVLGPIERLRAKWQGRDLQGAVDHAGHVILEAGRSLGAIMSFESPLSSKRTVVVITAGDSKRLTAVTSLFTEAGKSQFVRGDLVLFNGDQVNNYHLGDQYHVGSLPILMRFRWWLSQQPVVMLFLSLLAALLLSIVLYRVLRRMAMLRKQGGH